MRETFESQCLPNAIAPFRSLIRVTPPVLLQSDTAKTPAALDAAFARRRGSKLKGMMSVALNVQAVMTVEDGQKVVRARCRLGDKVHNLRPLECML